VDGENLLTVELRMQHGPLEMRLQFDNTAFGGEDGSIKRTRTQQGNLPGTPLPGLTHSIHSYTTRYIVLNVWVKTPAAPGDCPAG